MAAHGSGAVMRSREQGLILLNIDVGGGTTKISLIDNGKIRATGALNVGARLVAYDKTESIVRLEKGGRRLFGTTLGTISIWATRCPTICGGNSGVGWRRRFSMP